jgi:hypothetical protein
LKVKEVSVSEAHDVDDASIPLVTDVLVAGSPARARSVFPAAAAAVPADAASPSPASASDVAVAPETEGLYAHDADALVDRLRGRCLAWLTGEGRSVIEARCSAAMQEHSHWIVGQVSREIGLALETELKGWVKAAVREELAARSGQPPASGDA